MFRNITPRLQKDLLCLILDLLSFIKVRFAFSLNLYLFICLIIISWIWHRESYRPSFFLFFTSSTVRHRCLCFGRFPNNSKSTRQRLQLMCHRARWDISSSHLSNLTLTIWSNSIWKGYFRVHLKLPPISTWISSYLPMPSIFPSRQIKTNTQLWSERMADGNFRQLNTLVSWEVFRLTLNYFSKKNQTTSSKEFQ